MPEVFSEIFLSYAGKMLCLRIVTGRGAVWCSDLVVCCPAVVQTPPSWASSWLGGWCRSVCYILFKFHLCLVFLADRVEPPKYSFWRKNINSMQDVSFCVQLLLWSFAPHWDLKWKITKCCHLLENNAGHSKLVGYMLLLKFHACLQVAGWLVNLSQTASVTAFSLE